MLVFEPARLRVATDAISCDAWFFWIRRTLVHREPVVVVSRQRLLPYGVLGRTTVELTGENGERAHIGVYWPTAVLRALTDAGYEVAWKKAWILPLTGWFAYPWRRK
jgi:hypothetical protein